MAPIDVASGYCGEDRMHAFLLVHVATWSILTKHQPSYPSDVRGPQGLRTAETASGEAPGVIVQANGQVVETSWPYDRAMIPDQDPVLHKTGPRPRKHATPRVRCLGTVYRLPRAACSSSVGTP